MNNQHSELEAIKQDIIINEHHLKSLYESNQAHISFEDFYEIPYLIERINSQHIEK